MLGEEERNFRPSGGDDGGGSVNRKTYLRSVSWTDRSPRKPNPRPQSNNKARLCLPPLQPLSISPRCIDEWPRPGSDDLGIWPQAPTPGAKGSIKQLQNSHLEKPEIEFQFKKDKLAFFDKECSRVADHVYLGSDVVAKNREILRENGITHVLNCVGFVSPEYFKNELVYKTLWLQDSSSEDITSILYDVFDYFEDVREHGGRVFVHCCQGVSRSTSLVIAYLMWRERKTFEDALQYVKAARGVTNPNMGFACQLLLCQKRTLAFMESPNSVLRMYRMAPHSPYDPLHLVPKMLSEPGPKGLDSRGAFVIHAPSMIYVWIGKYCISVMSDNASAAAFQVIRYEMAQGPVVTIKEGEEPPEFWDALVNKQGSQDGCRELKIKEEEIVFSRNDKLSDASCPGIGERKVDLYDQDFEIFHKALAGGVVPPFPLSGTRSETCLPAREDGWDILRTKFARGTMKELNLSSKLSCETPTQTSRGSDSTTDHIEFDFPVSPSNSLLLSGSKSGSPGLPFCSPTNSPNRVPNTCKEVEPSDPQSSPTPSCSYSFSSFLVHSPKFGTKSPSLSPSMSDYSSSFTFSPSSCNWSDLSYLSSQSSPSGLESPDSLEKAFSGNHTLKEENSCFPFKKTAPSIAERRGSNPPPIMRLPSVDEASQVPELVRSWSFSLTDLEDSVMRDAECNQSEKEAFFDAEMQDAGNELHSQVEDRREYDKFRLPSNDTTDSDTFLSRWVCR